MTTGNGRFHKWHQQKHATGYSLNSLASSLTGSSYQDHRHSTPPLLELHGIALQVLEGGLPSHSVGEDVEGLRGLVLGVAVQDLVRQHMEELRAAYRLATERQSPNSAAGPPPSWARAVACHGGEDLERVTN
eukprot:CAMPEP_0204595374 /NCGR_PEP_ID=MMETSP0661-20131031/52636_1 /ASSEMBLY_ACC=CAM_ASM_000606 /TAXON_ID=109239 /ORGANISM="Alexandrium margalefi, Strain AMGDE01CS-322" /LENGTH=131 /DNA_ID=CAMNT_0051605893 /DNA_START=139 /DNA_END=535 /DNA_ORIENTATION=-